MQYWIAVPARLSSAVTMTLIDHLNGLEEYYGTDFDSNLAMQLHPFRRYDHGRVVFYMPEDFAGKENLIPFAPDRPPLDVFYRCWQPVEFPWAERFSKLSPAPLSTRQR